MEELRLFLWIPHAGGRRSESCQINGSVPGHAGARYFPELVLQKGINLAKAPAWCVEDAGLCS
jgi:hypothetical protein